ncbi:carotenoid biosynthesis protein [Hufsiella ginkgonis]|uniref:Carotenoid biosynthesis protein n=1 Tax=Hufsiella ginkgonis TaxID=2695274 RepID=A0A7K1XVF7_9SPHI|nr:carotenoid biosynthesis protein [Hufsiella ginkgonis]MXV14749.1 carotenoid biosynthesis protein [Hufsiella ginkgonis]
MERPQDRFVKRYGAAALVVLFHAVGLAGFLLADTESLFLAIVPFHLLLMGGLLIADQRERNHRFWRAVSLVYTGGFLVELAGVKTGVIFGHYAYGSTLGVKAGGVPLLIGLNWVLLVCGAGAVTAYLGIKNRWLAAFAGAMLLAALDRLIEPVAVKYNYWRWEDNHVPVQNYVAWLVVSFIMLVIWGRLVQQPRNLAAATLYLVQLVFFAALAKF